MAAHSTLAALQINDNVGACLFLYLSIMSDSHHHVIVENDGNEAQKSLFLPVSWDRVDLKGELE